MKITVEGNVFEGTPEEIKEMMTLLGAEFPEMKEEEAETKPKTEKCKACVGERILITDAELTGGQYKNGDVRTVKAVNNDGVTVEEHSVGMYHSEYEVIIDEKATPTFREGDRVKALADGEDGEIKAGEVGKLMDTDAGLGESDPYSIGVGTDDDYDYFRPEDLELVTEFQIGDYVVALPEADDEYAITTSKMKLGKVIEGKTYGSDDLRVEIIAHAWDRCIGFSHSVESKYFRKATEEEIEKYTKPKSGRNPGKFKKGDIVRVSWMDGKGFVNELAEIHSGPIGDGAGGNYYLNGGKDATLGDDIELIAPVESRIDK